MTPDAIRAAADRFVQARRQHRRIDALEADVAPRSLEDAYAIQDVFAERWGEDTVGWKAACTSEEAQELLSVPEPICGRVFPSMLFESPAQLDAADYFARGVEGEFVFRLARDLPPRDEPYGRDEVAAAVASLHPGIEMVDPRWGDWLAAGPANLVADNAVGGAVIVGPGVADWQGLDIAAMKVSMAIDGEVRADGEGSKVLGHPLESLTWLANFRARRGDGLRAGQYVTSGTCTGVVFAEAGETATAAFDGLGDAVVRFR